MATGNNNSGGSGNNRLGHGTNTSLSIDSSARLPSTTAQNNNINLSDAVRAAGQRQVTGVQNRVAQTPAEVTLFGATPPAAPTTPPTPRTPPSAADLATPSVSADAASLAAFKGLSEAFGKAQGMKLDMDLEKKIAKEVFLLAQDLVAGAPIVSPMGPCSPPPGAIATMARLGPKVLTGFSPPAPPTQPDTNDEDVQKIFDKLKSKIVELLNKKLVEYSLVTEAQTTTNT